MAKMRPKSRLVRTAHSDLVLAFERRPRPFHGTKQELLTPYEPKDMVLTLGETTGLDLGAWGSRTTQNPPFTHGVECHCN